jgi:hypothetical protein
MDRIDAHVVLDNVDPDHHGARTADPASVFRRWSVIGALASVWS